MKVPAAAVVLAGFDGAPALEAPNREIVDWDKIVMEFTVMGEERLAIESLAYALDRGTSGPSGLTIDAPSPELWVDDNGVEVAGGTMLADHRNMTLDSGRFLVQAYSKGVGVYDKASADWRFFEYGDVGKGIRVLERHGDEIPLPEAAKNQERLSLQLDEDTQVVLGRRAPWMMATGANVDRYDVLLVQGDDAILVSSAPGRQPRVEQHLEGQTEAVDALLSRHSNGIREIDLTDIGASAATQSAQPQQASR